MLLIFKFRQFFLVSVLLLVLFIFTSLASLNKDKKFIKTM